MPEHSFKDAIKATLLAQGAEWAGDDPIKQSTVPLIANHITELLTPVTDQLQALIKSHGKVNGEFDQRRL